MPANTGIFPPWENSDSLEHSEFACQLAYSYVLGIANPFVLDGRVWKRLAECSYACNR